MIFYKTEEEIELLRRSNQLVSKTLAEVVHMNLKKEILFLLIVEFY